MHIVSIVGRNGRGAARRQTGFTIIEVIVVLAVFGIAALTLSRMYSSIQSIQRDSYYLSIATRAAHSEIDLLRTSNGYATVTNSTTFTSQLPSTMPAGSTGTIAVSTPANAPNSKQVAVTVSYPNGSLSQQVTINAILDPPRLP